MFEQDRRHGKFGCWLMVYSASALALICPSDIRADSPAVVPPAATAHLAASPVATSPAVIAPVANVPAANVPAAIAPAEPLHQQIDRLIAAQTPNYSAIAAPIADDAEFLRRVFLDFAGRIPTTTEARSFLADTDPAKRQKVIDQLIASPDCARQLQRVFDVMLLQRRPAKYVPAVEWQTYLYKSFLENKPWDQLVRELLSADGSDPASRAASRFYLEREGEVNEITRDIGRIFLGVNLECAQCHNHPHVEDWKQRHYYGISAFLVRGFVFNPAAPPKAVYAENAEGEVKFESVFEIRDKVSTGPKWTLPRIFEGSPVDEPKFDFGQEYLVAPAKDVRPIPNYSRRALLGDALATPENRQFRRALANRLWGLLLGRGLIQPLEYDHSENPPSHPALLELLTDDLAARKLDVKSFLREIALSQTYQRSSRRPAPTTVETSDDATFSQAILKPLLPEQFALSIMQGTGFMEFHRASLGAAATEAALYERLAGHENRFIALFGGEAGKPAKDFDSSVEQVLFLANDPTVQGWLQPAGDNLTARLAKLPSTDFRPLAEELYLSVLTRLPSDEEVQEVTDYLTLRAAERPLALTELVWALLTSAEFRFNH